MISDEAVESAAAGMWEQRPMQRTTDGAPLPFHKAKAYQRTRYLHLARAALAAAAPHMLAGLAEQAWAEADEDVPPSPTSYAWSDKCTAASDWLEAKAKAAGWVPRG